MKFKLSLVALASFLMVSLAPLSLANTEKDFSSFDVGSIFIEDDKGTETTEDDESVIGDLRAETEANANVSSPAMALILRVINILSLLVGTFAFVMILIGGFIFATSGGDEGQVDKGKAILQQSIVGLVFAFLSYSIVLFIQSFFYN